MKLNIYLQELKSRLRSVLTWSASLVALLLVFLALFQSFAEQSAVVAEMMDSFPRELLIAFGMTDMDWSTVLGFYALGFTFVQICLAVQAANYGVSLVSIEETELTADFLLAKPVNRRTIMTSKLLAAITGLLITDAFLWAATFFLLNVFSQGQAFETKPLLLLLLSAIVLQLFFLMVGMAISLLVKRVRSVTPYSMGLVFGLYIFNAFGGMIGERSLEVISPFKHFTPSYIINNAAWDTSLVWISVVAIVVALVASYVLYQRRNIASAA